jgi:hypothetical protein
MPDRERTPYDVLGITPEATVADVHDAYERALADAPNAAEREARTTAYLHLRNTARRLGTDILEYAATDPAATAREAFAGVAEEPFLSPGPPPAPPVAALVVLRRADSAEDHREPPATKGTFVVPGRFTAYADVLPPVDIPR